MGDEFPVEVSKAQKGLNLLHSSRGRSLEDGCHLGRIHADPGLGDQKTHECHLLPVELALLYLCVQLVLAQDLQDFAKVDDMLLWSGREDDYVIQDPQADDVKVLPQYVIHKVLKHCGCIGGTLGAHLVLEVAFFASKGGLPLVPLPHPHLVVSIP